MATRQTARTHFEPSGIGIDPTKGVSLYIQLANLFRYRITSGAWPPGYRLDNFETIAAQFKVARVTVRQAVAILVQDGLLSARRGIGTVVCDHTSADSRARSGSGERITRQRQIEIRVDSRTRVVKPPPEFAGDFELYDAYQEVTKVHMLRGVPFGAIRIFVADEIYKRFPRRAIEKSTMLRLVLEHAPELSAQVRQIITVEPSDYRLSELLNYPFGSPIAKIMRYAYGDDRRLAYSGMSWYRGDGFEMDMTLPRTLVEAFPPSLIAPGLRSSLGRDV